MTYRSAGRTALALALLAAAGMTAACESDVDRAMREEREALKASGQLEELEDQLQTKNPDPYDPKNSGTMNIGRFKQN